VSYDKKEGYTHFWCMGNEITPPAARWFRTDAADMAIESIDTNAGVLYGVVMCQEGPAKGHGVHLDRDFIENLVAYDRKHHKKAGIKARFGHPSASGETMGTQLGVFQNPRTREVNGKMQAIADLHLLDAAEASPTHPGMRSWVQQMSTERPDFMMSSIVFASSGYYQVIEKKKKPVEWDYEKGKWDTEYQAEPIFVDFDEKKGARHYYTDLVEQGAATDNLFSYQANPHLFAAQVDAFLHEHPELLEFVKNNPDVVSTWMARAGYTSTNTTTRKKMAFNIKEWLFGTGEPNTDAPTATELSEMRTALQEAKTALTQLRTERNDFEQKYNAALKEATDLKAQATTLLQQVTDLSAQVKSLSEQVAQLSKTAADEPTGGPSGTGTPATDRAYKANPINKHLYSTK
jgi:hypothetical protein